MLYGAVTQYTFANLKWYWLYWIGEEVIGRSYVTRNNAEIYLPT